MNSWTTFNQAQKLVRAGIDESTADMHFLKQVRENDVVFIPEPMFEDIYGQQVEGDYPCWGIGALLELMNPAQRGHFLSNCAVTQPIVGQLVDQIISLKELNLL